MISLSPALWLSQAKHIVSKCRLDLQCQTFDWNSQHKRVCAGMRSASSAFLNPSEHIPPTTSPAGSSAVSLTNHQSGSLDRRSLRQRRRRVRGRGNVAQVINAQSRRNFWSAKVHPGQRDLCLLQIISTLHRPRRQVLQFAKNTIATHTQSGAPWVIVLLAHPVLE